MVALVDAIINLQIRAKMVHLMVDLILHYKVHFMMDLMLHLKGSGTLEFTLKAIENIQKDDEKDTLDV